MGSNKSIEIRSSVKRNAIFFSLHVDTVFNFGQLQVQKPQICCSVIDRKDYGDSPQPTK